MSCYAEFPCRIIDGNQALPLTHPNLRKTHRLALYERVDEITHWLVFWDTESNHLEFYRCQRFVNDDTYTMRMKMKLTGIRCVYIAVRYDSSGEPKSRYGERIRRLDALVRTADCYTM